MLDHTVDESTPLHVLALDLRENLEGPWVQYRDQLAEYGGDLFGRTPNGVAEHDPISKGMCDSASVLLAELAQEQDIVCRVAVGGVINQRPGQERMFGHLWVDEPEVERVCDITFDQTGNQKINYGPYEQDYLSYRPFSFFQPHEAPEKTLVKVRFLRDILEL